MPITFITPPSRQLFSIPNDFISYITQNPASPKGLENLQQTCKYFFAKNPILFPPHLVCFLNGYHYSAFVSKTIKTVAKFWPTELMVVHWCKLDPNKFYRFSPVAFAIIGSLSMEEFNLVTAENTISHFGLNDGEIRNATIDVVLEKLPNVSWFYYQNLGETFSLKSLQNLSLMERKLKFDSCEIYISKATKDFSSSLLLKFIEKNCCLKSEFRFHFSFDLVLAKRKLMDAIKKWKTTEIVKSNLKIVLIS